MGVANSLFNRDLARLAQSPDQPKLMGRPATDRNVLEEAEFFLKNGMSRAAYAEMRAAMRREEADAQAVRDLNGNPPELTNTRGLGPKRAALANYFEWVCVETKKRDSLLARRIELEEMIAAPAASEARIRDAVRQTATTLVGRVHASAKIDRSAMDVQLAQERHMAEAATVALAEIEGQIENAERRVEFLGSREADFTGPALVEDADNLKLGQIYLEKIAELRAICDLMNGLASVAGGYGSGFENRTEIKFPKVGLPSISGADNSAYVISSAGNSDVWRQITLALRMNPKMDAAKFIPVPK